MNLNLSEKFFEGINRNLDILFREWQR